MEEKEMKENNNEEAVKEKKKKFDFLKKKEIWISGLIGLILGGVIIYVLGVFGFPGLGHETVATFKGGRVRKNEMYNQMEKQYPIDYVLESIDKSILEKIYDVTDKEKEEIKENAESILSMYQMYYGYTEEQFLDKNGFNTKEEFIDYLEFDFRRNLCVIDYYKTLIPTEKIEKYYNDNVYGEINTKHMLVKKLDTVTEEQALATANEILAKLKAGKSFDDVANEYKDKITTEEVDFDNFEAANLAKEYVEASKKLEKDKYTTEPVKTSFGYHIIYCLNKADKPSLEETERDIVEVLGADLEKEDQNIRVKALIKLREDKNVKFKNKDLEEKYKEYCDEVNKVESTDTAE